jgi:hypothetical protein
VPDVGADLVGAERGHGAPGDDALSQGGVLLVLQRGGQTGLTDQQDEEWVPGRRGQGRKIRDLAQELVAQPLCLVHDEQHLVAARRGPSQDGPDARREGVLVVHGTPHPVGAEDGLEEIRRRLSRTRHPAHRDPRRAEHRDEPLRQARLAGARVAGEDRDAVPVPDRARQGIEDGAVRIAEPETPRVGAGPKRR